MTTKAQKAASAAAVAERKRVEAEMEAASELPRAEGEADEAYAARQADAKAKAEADAEFLDAHGFSKAYAFGKLNSDDLAGVLHKKVVEALADCSAEELEAALASKLKRK